MEAGSCIYRYQSKPSINARHRKGNRSLGSESRTRRKVRKKNTEPTNRTIPGTNFRSQSRGTNQKGAFGAGVLKSLEPHSEQTSALRGLRCLAGQSLTS